MSQLEAAALTMTPGSRRVTSVWVGPSAAGARAHVPQSAGAWVEREPHTYARLKVAIPVTVGSTLRIR